MDKKKIIKLIVPVCIVLVIAGIWIFKNYGKSPDGEAINKEDFALEASSVDLDTLTAYNLPIIIDFGSDSCIPCQEMAPVLKTMNAEMQGKAIIKFIDVWKYTDAADGFPVQVSPHSCLLTPMGRPMYPRRN
jgi:thioredoxin 1